jgi:sulfur relay (sulfurtransferase) complex TusBCD TusD component (DsrE family)
MNAELLKSQIIEYSVENVYLAEKFVIPKCSDCGCGIFTLVINADEGVAARTCTSCNSEQGIADSDNFLMMLKKSSRSNVAAVPVISRLWQQ